MHQLVVPPDANVHPLFGGIRHRIDIEIFTQGYVGDLDFVLERSDAQVGIHQSGRATKTHPKASGKVCEP